MIRELKGWHVLVVFLGFFAVTFAVNGVFMTYALSTFSGEDVKTPYLRGLEYNKKLAARAEQRTLGWTASIDLERKGQSGAVVLVAISAKDGAPRDGLVVEATLRRPTDASLDRTLKLEAAGGGAYRATVDELAAGQWDVVVRDVAADGTPFEAERRVVLP